MGERSFLPRPVAVDSVAAAHRALSEAVLLREDAKEYPHLHPTAFVQFLSLGHSTATIAFDEADRTIRAYEVKRGNGRFDAGKIRSIKRDLLCTQVLLKSYGDVAKCPAEAAEARIIFYYGLRSIPKPWSLDRDELDEHFGYPVVPKIEQANEYFRIRLHELLASA